MALKRDLSQMLSDLREATAKDEDDEYSVWHRAEEIASAEAMGYEIVRADDHTLQIDVDTPERDMKEFTRRLEKMKDYVKVTSVKWTKSKSGNWHCTIKLDDPMPIGLRIAFQMWLGSDMVREFINAARVHVGAPDPIVFFELKKGSS